jgi:hypothetical protein
MDGGAGTHVLPPSHYISIPSIQNFAHNISISAVLWAPRTLDSQEKILISPLTSLLLPSQQAARAPCCRSSLLHGFTARAWSSTHRPLVCTHRDSPPPVSSLAHRRNQCRRTEARGQRRWEPPWLRLDGGGGAMAAARRRRRGAMACCDLGERASGSRRRRHS